MKFSSLFGKLECLVFKSNKLSYDTYCKATYRTWPTCLDGLAGAILNIRSSFVASKNACLIWQTNGAPFLTIARAREAEIRIVLGPDNLSAAD